ncbi:YbaB/EbfC family nucleoid-associated protein [Plantactinospora sp. GCM10030261]|uniref:YbaB/EbfC family nucleoid-associated protein n=1 Tax=Plantactinospora sp. GCM10030261 TaxID=3273420 RepID=UPI00361A31E0
MERPQWSALRGVVEDLRHTLANAEQTRQEMLQITGTAWSEDRLIKAVVGPRGQLVEIDIDPRIYRTPNSKALSAAIMATVRAAVDDVNAQVRDVMRRALPTDTTDSLGRTDFDVLLDRHDAELPTAFRKEDGHGYVY